MIGSSAVTAAIELSSVDFYFLFISISPCPGKVDHNCPRTPSVPRVSREVYKRCFLTSKSSLTGIVLLTGLRISDSDYNLAMIVIVAVMPTDRFVEKKKRRASEHL